MAEIFEDSLARELAGVIRECTAPLHARIQELELRVRQLEARPSDVKACGVWIAEREYNGGNLTVHNGSMWCAQERTKSKPGTDATWQLYVKQGTFSK